jgi:hypothetical protein
MGWTKEKQVKKPFRIVVGTRIRITAIHKTDLLCRAINIGRTGILIDSQMISRVDNDERRVFISCDILLDGDHAPTRFSAVRFKAAQPAQSTFYRNIHLIRAGVMCPECHQKWSTKGPCRHGGEKYKKIGNPV